MTLAEMHADVKRRLHEASGSGVYFAYNDIRDALHAGYMEISDASEWCEQTLGIPILKDRQYYDLQTIIGPRFLSLKPVFDEATNRWLIPSTVRGLDTHDQRWERVTGRPVRHVMRGIKWMGVYGRETAAGTYLRASYTALPAPLCDDTDEPGFPAAFHVGCVYYALADLFAQDAESPLALAAWQDYLAIETALTQWVNDRIQRPQLRVMGGGGPI